MTDKYERAWNAVIIAWAGLKAARGVIETLEEIKELDAVIEDHASMIGEPLDDIGEHVTIERFMNNVLGGGLINNDGFGFYANETEQFPIPAIPSEIFRDGGPNKRFTHVMWYNK